MARHATKLFTVYGVNISPIVLQLQLFIAFVAVSVWLTAHYRVNSRPVSTYVRIYTLVHTYIHAPGLAPSTPFLISQIPYSNVLVVKHHLLVMENGVIA